MTRYNIAMKVRVDIEPEEVERALVEALNSYLATIDSIQIKERKPPGRPEKKDPKVDRWLVGRTKPYTLKQFASYMDISISAGHRRLARLVAARKVEKIKGPSGVTYLNRPD